jgi:hypothetical protein
MITLPREYSDPDLKKFFDACSGAERVLFSTFLFTGIREQEVVHLFWADVKFDLNTVRVTAKPDLGFSPKRWEDYDARGVDSCSRRREEIGNSICSTTVKRLPSEPN